MPAVAEIPGLEAASAMAISARSGVSPMATMCPTPAAPARASTASRSASKAGSARWQWVSTSTAGQATGWAFRPPDGAAGAGLTGAAPRCLTAAPGHRCSIQSRTGDAMKIEENVPVKTPKNITSANGRITSPPRIASAASVESVVPCVSTLRGSVSLIARLSTVANVTPRIFRRSSRTRSKMMMVSLSEYPTIDSTARHDDEAHFDAASAR